MLLTLTPITALEIQARQILWYGHKYPTGTEGLRIHIQHLNNLESLPSLADPLSIFEINQRIPRGGQIETIIQNAQQGFCRLPQQETQWRTPTSTEDPQQ